jgi:hypothetical protein
MRGSFDAERDTDIRIALCIRGSFGKSPQRAKSALAGDPDTPQDDGEKQTTATAEADSLRE